MPDNANITPELLRQLLRYEPDTGKLFWRPRPVKMFASESYCKSWNTRFSGKEAFTFYCFRGYRQGAIFSRLQKAHRIVWMIERGEIQEGMIIDHINGIAGDNRIENLRLATQAQNMCNRRVQSNSVTGIKGVSFHIPTKKWRASIGVKGKQIHLGLFDSISAAEAAYLAAAEKHQKQFAYHNRLAQ